jgi:hypothetical protein
VVCLYCFPFIYCASLLVYWLISLFVDDVLLVVTADAVVVVIVIV